MFKCQLALLLFAMARCGSFLNIWTLAKLGTVFQKRILSFLCYIPDWLLYYLYFLYLVSVDKTKLWCILNWDAERTWTLDFIICQLMQCSLASSPSPKYAPLIPPTLQDMVNFLSFLLCYFFFWSNSKLIYPSR